MFQITTIHHWQCHILLALISVFVDDHDYPVLGYCHGLAGRDFDIDDHDHVDCVISVAMEPYSCFVTLSRHTCCWEYLSMFYSGFVYIYMLLVDVLYQYCHCYCRTSMITVVWLSLFACMQTDPTYEISLLRLHLSQFLLLKHDYICLLKRFNPLFSVSFAAV